MFYFQICWWNEPDKPWILSVLTMWRQHKIRLIILNINYGHTLMPVLFRQRNLVVFHKQTSCKYLENFSIYFTPHFVDLWMEKKRKLCCRFSLYGLKFDKRVLACYKRDTLSVYCWRHVCFKISSFKHSML